MTRFACSIILFAAVSLSVSSCGAASPSLDARQPTSGDPAAEKAFKSARDLFEGDRLDEAKTAFETFTREHRRDPLYGIAIVYRARIAIAKVDEKTALSLCTSLDGIATDSFTKERARLYEGIAASGVGDNERAVRLLSPFVGSLPDPDENRLLLSRLWRSAFELGDLSRSLTWMDAFIASGPDAAKREETMRSLDALLSRISKSDALVEVAAALDAKGASWPRVMGKLVRTRYEAGDLDSAASALAEIEDRGRQADAGVDDIAVLIEKRTRVDLAAIGCILPLSGRARAVGEAALRGVMLGAKSARLPDGRPFSIVVRDTEGDPARAAAAVDALAVDSGVAAIIGPLDGAEAEAVAKRAEALGLPLILLAPKDDLRAAKALRIFPSSRAEVTALVDTALDGGAKKHAILYPDTAYGTALRDLYAEALARFGLAPEALVAYPDGTQDFTPFAKQLAGRGVEVVFVPDTASRISLAAPALAAAGVLSTALSTGEGRKSGAILSATSAGFSQEVVRRAGRYLQGSLFAAHFAESASASAADFAHRYRNEYNGEPTQYATYGHDAVVLLTWAVANGAASRKAIGKAVRASDAKSVAKAMLAGRFDGFTEDGAPASLPFVMTLVGDVWKVVR